MRASLIYLGQMGNILFAVKLTKAYVRKKVCERWRRKCHGLGDVFCSRIWASYTAAWQNECKCSSEAPSATCRLKVGSSEQ